MAQGMDFYKIIYTNNFFLFLSLFLPMYVLKLLLVNNSLVLSHITKVTLRIIMMRARSRTKPKIGDEQF